MGWLRRLRGTMFGSSVDANLDEELRFHVDERTADLIRQRMGSADARREALRRFGNVTRARENAREMDTLPWLGDIGQDVSYALRALTRNPTFAAVAILTLALGIGANTAIFTIVDAVLIERPPFHDPDRLVVIWEESSRRPGQHNVVSPANFLRWQERVRSFEPLAAYFDTRGNLTGSNNPEEVVVQRVTAPFFSTLRVSPLLGRTFTNEESRDRQAAVAILSYDLWQRRFGGDLGIVGRTIQFNAVPTTVVGVMPHGFGLYMKAGGLAGKPAELWTPYVPALSAREVFSRSLTVIARLKPRVGLSQAGTEMETTATTLAAEFPDANAGWTARVVTLQEEMSSPYRQGLFVLASAVAFVLLIACANVANLLLVRGAARQREIAIRLALGAGRGRIARQLLTESFTLAVFGGIVGLFVARWSLNVLLLLNPVEFSPTAHVALSVLALIFTGAVSLLTAILSGVAPAFVSSQVDADHVQRAARYVDSGPNQSRLRDALVVTEIALAFVLLVGSGLMIKSLGALRDVKPGFETDGLLTMRMQLPAAKYGDDGKRIRFFQAVTSQIQELSGVHAVGVISYLPLSGSTARTTFAIDGAAPSLPGQAPTTDFYACDNGYFQAIGLPLRQGRFFSDRELRDKSNVVIVNESLVRIYFPHQDPIGKRVSVAAARSIVPMEVVGVVADMRSHALSSEEVPTTYWPYAQLAPATMSVVLRTPEDPLAVAPSVERAIQSIDSDQPVSDVRSMRQWIARSLAQTRFITLLLAGFSLVALTLAVMGIYGVISYVVALRTAEFGIRVALGADSFSIWRLVVARGARLTVTGLAIGTLLALGLNRTVSTQLYQTTSTDPLTFVGVLLLLGCVALLACLVPARRAAQADPIVALRCD